MWTLCSMNWKSDKVAQEVQGMQVLQVHPAPQRLYAVSPSRRKAVRHPQLTTPLSGRPESRNSSAAHRLIAGSRQAPEVRNTRGKSEGTPEEHPREHPWSILRHKLVHARDNPKGTPKGSTVKIEMPVGRTSHFRFEFCCKTNDAQPKTISQNQ